jgi:hypothetical protein
MAEKLITLADIARGCGLPSDAGQCCVAESILGYPCGGSKEGCIYWDFAAGVAKITPLDSKGLKLV